MSEVDRLAEIIRGSINASERDLNYFIVALESVDDGDYSPRCLSMMRLENDAKTLRALADRIEAQRARLITQTHLVAAE